MTRFRLGFVIGVLIDILNWLWLGLVLVGLPQAASKSVLGIHLSSSDRNHQLLLGALAVGLLTNGLSGLFIAKKKPTRRRFFKWTAAFMALLTLAGLEAAGLIGFDWLRKGLVSIKGLF